MHLINFFPNAKLKMRVQNYPPRTLKQVNGCVLMQNNKAWKIIGDILASRVAKTSFA